MNNQTITGFIFKKLAQGNSVIDIEVSVKDFMRENGWVETNDDDSTIEDDLREEVRNAEDLTDSLNCILRKIEEQ